MKCAFSKEMVRKKRYYIFKITFDLASYSRSVMKKLSIYLIP